MSQLLAVKNLYGGRYAIKRDFRNIVMDHIGSLETVIPVEAKLSYKKLIPLYEKKTGSKVMLSYTDIFDLRSPDTCVIEKRGGPKADKYIIVLSKDTNHRLYIDTVTPNQIPDKTALTLREYMLYDLNYFTETGRHVDEVYHYTSNNKARPYNICFATEFKYGKYQTYPKVFHHNKMLVIDIFCMATWKEGIFRNFNRILM